jgi:hypothetical protein
VLGRLDVCMRRLYVLGVGGRGFGIATLNVESMVINDDVARIHQSPRVV